MIQIIHTHSSLRRRKFVNSASIRREMIADLYLSSSSALYRLDASSIRVPLVVSGRLTTCIVTRGDWGQRSGHIIIAC